MSIVVTVARLSYTGELLFIKQYDDDDNIISP